jgi:hypothetical protein
MLAEQTLTAHDANGFTIVKQTFGANVDIPLITGVHLTRFENRIQQLWVQRDDSARTITLTFTDERGSLRELTIDLRQEHITGPVGYSIRKDPEP